MMDRRAGSGAGAWQLSDWLSCLVECKFGFNTSHVRWGTFPRLNSMSLTLDGLVPWRWTLRYGDCHRILPRNNGRLCFPNTLPPPSAPREASASSLLSCKNSSCVPGLRRSVLSPHLRKKKKKHKSLVTTVLREPSRALPGAILLFLAGFPS